MAGAQSADNCTDADAVLQQRYLPVGYGLIFVVALVGNVTAIGVYVIKLRPWKSSSIIMVNLALTDLLYSLSLPFLVYYYHNGNSWRLGDFMCRFVRFGFNFHLYGSILFLTCLAVFRYVVVMHPLRTAQVQQKCWGIIASVAVWVIAAAEITPMLVKVTLSEVNNKTFCLDFASAPLVEDVRCYAWLIAAFGFLLPLVVVSMCYIRIAKELAEGPTTSCACRIRARRSIVLILVVFVVCFLPFQILRILRIETRKQEDASCLLVHGVNAAYILSRPLAGFNTFFNLALYTLSGDAFREALIGTFSCQCWLKRADPSPGPGPSPDLGPGPGPSPGPVSP